MKGRPAETCWRSAFYFPALDERLRSCGEAAPSLLDASIFCGKNLCIFLYDSGSIGMGVRLVSIERGDVSLWYLTPAKVCRSLAGLTSGSALVLLPLSESPARLPATRKSPESRLEL